MPFKAEELTTQVFPIAGDGLWACPESTIGKKGPCPQNTHVPCPDNTHPPCPGGTIGCPENTIPSPTHRPPARASGLDGPDLALSLLQGQLRERLAQGIGNLDV